MVNASLPQAKLALPQPMRLQLQERRGLLASRGRGARSAPRQLPAFVQSLGKLFFSRLV
jgi:hypothetical protein